MLIGAIEKSRVIEALHSVRSPFGNRDVMHSHLVQPLWDMHRDVRHAAELVERRQRLPSHLTAVEHCCRSRLRQHLGRVEREFGLLSPMSLDDVIAGDIGDWGESYLYDFWTLWVPPTRVEEDFDQLLLEITGGDLDPGPVEVVRAALEHLGEVLLDLNQYNYLYILRSGRVEEGNVERRDGAFFDPHPFGEVGVLGEPAEGRQGRCFALPKDLEECARELRTGV